MSTYSEITATGTGAPQVVNVPWEYLDTAYVVVAVDGIVQTVGVGYSWSGPGSITLTAAAAAVITVSRATDIVDRLTDYQNGVPLTEGDLDEDSLQAFHLIQEATDKVTRLETTVGGITTVVGGGGGPTIQTGMTVADEGSGLGTPGTVSVLNFEGAGVTAARVGNQVNVTVPAGIADAPSDGTEYSRKNAGWVAAIGGGIADAASDSVLYGRKNAAWVAVPEQALPGESTYIRDFSSPATTANVTGYGPSATFTIVSNKLRITAAASTYALARLTDSPQAADFDLTFYCNFVAGVSTADKGLGIMYRTPLWGGGRWRGGYHFGIGADGGCGIGKGDQTGGNTDGTFTSVVSVAAGTIPTAVSGREIKVRLRVTGARHQVWVDDVSLIDHEDFSYPASPSNVAFMAVEWPDAVEFRRIEMKYSVSMGALLDFLPLAGGIMDSGAAIGSTGTGTLAPSNGFWKFKPSAASSMSLYLEPMHPTNTTTFQAYSYDLVQGGSGSSTGDNTSVNMTASSYGNEHLIHSRKHGAGFYAQYRWIDIGAGLAGGLISRSCTFGWDKDTGLSPFMNTCADFRINSVGINTYIDARIALAGSGATNLGYTAATRVLTSDTGTDVTLPLVSTADAGLAPASGGGTANYLRADGTWAAPAGSGGSATSYVDQVLVDSPTRYFRMNDASGTAAVDSSANGVNGTYYNSPTLAQTSMMYGGEGAAVLFNGTTQYLGYSGGLPASVASNSLVIAEAVVNISSASMKGCFFSIQIDGKNFGLGVGSTDMATNGNNLLALQQGNAYFSSSAALGTGDKHVVFAWSKPNTTLYMFIDGALVSSSATSAAAYAGVDTIGALASSSLPFAGKIQEFSTTYIAQIGSTYHPSVIADIVRRRFNSFKRGIGGGGGASGTATPAGSNKQLQFNNAGVMGAAGVDYDIATTTLSTTAATRQPFNAVTYGATTTINCQLGNAFRVALTGNITTLTVSNPQDGQCISVLFVQDGTGSRTVAWPASFLFVGQPTPVLSLTLNYIDLLSGVYSATDSKWLVSLSKQGA